MQIAYILPLHVTSIKLREKIYIKMRIYTTVSMKLDGALSIFSARFKINLDIKIPS